MTESFRDAVPNWAAIASRLLGWRPHEFWRATPAELAMALREPAKTATSQAPSRNQIAQMMERDDHG